jgi:hypothetical protein
LTAARRFSCDISISVDLLELILCIVKFVNGYVEIVNEVVS